jgi:hypothetical protein
MFTIPSAINQALVHNPVAFEFRFLGNANTVEKSLATGAADAVSPTENSLRLIPVPFRRFIAHLFATGMRPRAKPTCFFYQGQSYGVEIGRRMKHARQNGCLEIMAVQSDSP